MTERSKPRPFRGDDDVLSDERVHIKPKQAAPEPTAESAPALKSLGLGICARCGKAAPKGMVVCDACQAVADTFNRDLREQAPSQAGFPAPPDALATAWEKRKELERTVEAQASRLRALEARIVELEQLMTAANALKEIR